MAADKPTRFGKGGNRKWRRGVLTAVLLVSLAALAWFWVPLKAQARAWTSFDARIACSCRYVAQRAMSDCRGDLPNRARFVMLSDDESERSVTATFPLLASQTATHRAGQGCVLERWRD